MTEIQTIYVKLLQEICSWIDPKNPENCIERGWDGYDAEPITETVCVIAINILNKLYRKGYINSITSFTPSPCGEFSIEWYIDKDNYIDITVDLESHDTKYLWFYENSETNDSRHGSYNSIEELYPLIETIVKPQKVTDNAANSRTTLTWSDIGD